MNNWNKKIFQWVITGLLVTGVFGMASAETINLNAPQILSRVEVRFSPRTGSFVEGSTFEVPIIMDTKSNSVNSIELHIGFDKNKLSVVQPSGGKSIVGMWVEPPVYDNTKGTARYVGVIPGGITTNSGLVGTITFKAKATGTAVVSLRSDSNVLLNDGLGTQAVLDLGRADYTIIAKAPEGVAIFSETHPFSGTWYNNNSPVFSWARDPGINGFNIVLDNKPNTIPESVVTSDDLVKAYQNLNDGLWYFHVKSSKAGGVWGTTGHFLARIDTTPPAVFKPEASYLVATETSGDRALVSFATTDNLSGIHHYEVGIIDKNQPATESPVFLETESPYQVPITKGSDIRVMVRAVDQAGNVRDASIDVHPPLVITRFLGDYLVYILAGIIILAFIMLMMHYLFGHHILRRLRRGIEIAEQEDSVDTAKIALNQTQVPLGGNGNDQGEHLAK